MIKKLFLSIEVPQYVKEELLLLKESLAELPIRWLELDEIVLLVKPLGFISEKRAIELIQSAITDLEPFDLKITDIELIPKMISAKVESDELNSRFTDSKPHIRIARTNLRQVSQDEIPILDSVDFSLKVDSLYLIDNRYRKIKEFKLR